MASRTFLLSTFAAALCALIGAIPAAAQPGAAAPATPEHARGTEQLALGIRIDGEAAEVDARAVRDAVAAELDIAVAEATAQQPALGVVTVTLDRNAARLVYRRVDGVSTERTLTLPSEPSARVELLAFMVTNLVRDQTSEALAQLSRRPVAAPRTEAPAAPDDRGEVAFSIGLAPPLLLDRLRGDHHVVGGGLYLLMGVQDGSRFASVSAVADYQRRFASGLQLGGVAAISPQVDGVQLAGGASVAGEAHGVQIGGAVSVASSITGVQAAGAVNVATEVHGVQIGTVNIAGPLHGVQLGILNISDGGDAIPIGLLNVARHGRTEFEGSLDSSAMSTVTLRHGPRHVQNVWGVGAVQGHARAFLGLGLGFHQAFEGVVPFAVDLDAMTWNPFVQGTSISGLHAREGGLAMINQLRATIAIPVGPIDLVGGVVANVYIDDGDGILADLHPHFEHVYRSGTTLVALWPSGLLGIRIRT